MAIDMAVKTDGHNRVNPSEYLSPIAQPVSNRPAIKRMIHAVEGFISKGINKLFKFPKMISEKQMHSKKHCAKNGNGKDVSLRST
jgi:hypothetical protein